MTSKERVYAVLNHQEPDRVPRGENKFDNNFFRGVMYDTLDTFDELGVDGWHGIQPSVGMYPEKLAERYGGVNVETIIAGTPDNVRRGACLF